MLYPFLLVIMSFNSPAQNDNLIHKVVRYYKNGTPRVEYCYDPVSKERVKEICFFQNGHLDYTGEYQNGKEHGEWIYYWENGIIRAQEYYIHGHEDGVMYDYNKQGVPIIEFTYKMGKLISKKELTSSNK